MKVIESDKNQWIKRMRALEKRKYRLAFEQFVAEGRRFVEEALESGAMVHVILIAEGSEEKYEELLAGYDGPAFLVDPEILEDSMSTVNPQDIAAIVSFPDWSEELWPSDGYRRCCRWRSGSRQSWLHHPFDPGQRRQGRVLS